MLVANGITPSLVSVCQSTTIPAPYVEACTNNKDYITKYTTLQEMKTLMEETTRMTAINSAYESAIQTASLVAENTSTSVANQVKKASIEATKTSLGTLYNGVDMLDNGINELSTGITKYNDEGIKVLSDIVDNKVKPTSARVKKLVNLGNEYQLTNKNNTDETKFVLVIDSKEKKVEEKTNTNKETKTSFIDKIKNLFK